MRLGVRAQAHRSAGEQVGHLADVPFGHADVQDQGRRIQGHHRLPAGPRSHSTLVDHGLCSEALRRVDLVRGAHHADHAAAGDLTELQERAADATRGRVHQHDHAGPKPQELVQGEVGGHEHRWEACRLLDGKGRRGAPRRRPRSGRESLTIARAISASGSTSASPSRSSSTPSPVISSVLCRVAHVPLRERRLARIQLRCHT